MGVPNLGHYSISFPFLPRHAGLDRHPECLLLLTHAGAGSGMLLAGGWQIT